MRPSSPLPRQILSVLAASAAILLAPLAAMQFTDEVNWSPVDFAIAAMLLCGTGLLYVLAARAVQPRRGRIALGLALAALLFLVWAELAVGLFGTPFAGS